MKPTEAQRIKIGERLIAHWFPSRIDAIDVAFWLNRVETHYEAVCAFVDELDRRISGPLRGE